MDVKVIKIDIEGYEYTALLGADQALERTSYILSEFSPAIMRRNHQDPALYFEQLEKHGFRAKYITPLSMEPVGKEKRGWLCQQDGVYNLLWEKGK